MQTVYADQPFPRTFHKSLYLAGPTPREAGVCSWRPEAVHLLESLSYDGVVFLPESQDGQRQGDYDQQMAWELEAMRRSDVLLFWVPAERETLPASTTRVEFGFHVHSGNVILGMPQETYQTHSMKKLAQLYHLMSHQTLSETVTAALAKLGAGAKRSGAECLIPLELWRAPHFQEWYAAQTAAGHTLVDVPNIEWVFRVGADRTFPLFIALHVAIRVYGEGRVKANEAVIIRPSIVTVCAYCPGETKAQDRFILVKEYRSSVMNAQGFVFELPGGSSARPDVDPLTVARDELAQETGLQLALERFRLLRQQQIAATMVANHAFLFVVRLEPAEMDMLAARQGDIYGNRAETEHTSLYVFTRQQLMEDQWVDYATLGQIALVGADGEEER